jgi:hypothetical protein
MSNDILKSVSQGNNGAYDAENRRIKEISDELQRLCQLHEAQPRTGQEDRGLFEIEQRVAEQYAKSARMWIPMDEVFDLGTPGPSGNENDTYVAKDSIFKVNNLLNSGSIHNLLDKIILHNFIFPNTAYKLIGFAGYDARSVMPVLEQERICNAHPATQILIDTYMSALGFTKENDEGRYSNGTYVVWDVVPRNVLVDADGDMYVVDAEIKKLI